MPTKQHVIKNEPQSAPLSAITPQEIELRVHLAEFDTLSHRHDLMHKMRQELGVYTLAGTVALIGALVAQSTIFQSDLLRVFLVLPFVFTLLGWWYIRTNWANLQIELYMLTKLAPRLSQIANAPVIGYFQFIWEIDMSHAGRIMASFQTVARLGLIQGPGIISLLIFGFGTRWNSATWNFMDWALIVLNLTGFVTTVILGFITAGLVSKIERAITDSS